MLIMPMVGLLLWLLLAPAVASELPVEAQGMEAVARVFLLAYRLAGMNINIELNEIAQPPWSEARIKAGRDDWFLESRGDPQCHYDLGDTVVEKQNGIETIGIGKERFASVAFGLLSPEIETTNDAHYVYVTVYGKPGAVCDVRNVKYGRPRCSDRLNATLMPDDVRPYLRALRFVFANVCKSTELPLGR
jgi:hypothetical protein